MNYRNILYVIASVIAFIAGSPAFGEQNETIPLNLIPMYGYPNIEKTNEQKELDKKFIGTVVANSGTREKASTEFAGEGWRYRSKGDAANAMRRFNQSWLLNPNNYLPYWGFGSILTRQGKAAEAVTHYEKALSLINDDKQKPRLLVDTAKAYFTIARKSTNKVESEKSFNKTNLLLSQAVELDPQYARSYQIWAFAHFEQGSYKKAWDMVKKSRSLGQEVNPKFIEELSTKMPEPN